MSCILSSLLWLISGQTSISMVNAMKNLSLDHDTAISGISPTKPTTCPRLSGLTFLWPLHHCRNFLMMTNLFTKFMRFFPWPNFTKHTRSSSSARTDFMLQIFSTLSYYQSHPFRVYQVLTLTSYSHFLQGTERNLGRCLPVFWKTLHYP